MLYLVAILKHPTPKAKKEGKLPTLVAEVEYFIAKNEDGARTQALLKHAKEIGNDHSLIEVLVRPF